MELSKLDASFMSYKTSDNEISDQEESSDEDNSKQLFETRYLRHDLADFLDLTEAIIFHTFFFGH